MPVILRLCLPRRVAPLVLALPLAVACASGEGSAPPSKSPPAPPASARPSPPPPSPADDDGDGEGGEPGARCPTTLDACPVHGCPIEGAAQAASNTLKNRRTARDGQPITRATATTVTFDELRALQASVDDLAGRYPDPAVRAARLVDLSVGARRLSEGTAVRLSGFVVKVRKQGIKRSDRGRAGESVNCFLFGEENNDYHLNVAPAPKLGEMDGIVVEAVPHDRPAAWSAAAFSRLMREKRQLLFVGPLFFDAVHRVRKPDDPRTARQPARFSLWEIHPLVELYACDRDACDPDREEGWSRIR